MQQKPICFHEQIENEKKLIGPTIPWLVLALSLFSFSHFFLNVFTCALVCA